MSRITRLALGIVGVLFAVLIVGGAGFQWVNSQPWFCNSCHEMNFYYHTWQTSTHGPQARCLECHAQPGIRGFIEEKVRGAEQLSAHITGNYEVPIKIIVRVRNQQCLTCHPDTATIQDKTIDVRHDVHMEKEVLCADCHSRIVHSRPDQPKMISTEQCESCHQAHPTSFMTGSHLSVNCSQCHTDLKYGKQDARCESCHQPPAMHPSGNATQCEQCHTPAGWKPAKVDHSAFPLTGNHQGLACEKCHPNGQFQGTSPKCESCHQAPADHVYGITANCGLCHTPAGWKPPKFDHSSFPLTDNHAGVPCEQCHPGGQFQGTSPKCESCHQAPADHVYGITTNCEMCHTPAGWVPPVFDHSIFPLTDNHAGVPCEQCHPNGQFQGTSPLCESCHQAPTDHIFGIASNCGLCHTPAGWIPAHFDHSKFPLTGAHKTLTCDQCHTSGSFTGLNPTCGSCHNAPATHAGMSTNCAQCHTTSGFSPSTFVHQQVGEHIPRGEHSLNCNQCHASAYIQASCKGSGCHTGKPGGGDD